MVEIYEVIIDKKIKSEEEIVDADFPVMNTLNEASIPYKKEIQEKEINDLGSERKGNYLVISVDEQYVEKVKELIGEELLNSLELLKEQNKLSVDNQLNILEQFKEQEETKANGLLSFIEQIKDIIQTISSTVNSISGNVSDYKSSLDKISSSNNSGSGNTNTGSGNTGSNNSNNNSDTNDSNINNSSWGSWFIYKKNRYPVSKLDVDKQYSPR